MMMKIWAAASVGYNTTMVQMENQTRSSALARRILNRAGNEGVLSGLQVVPKGTDHQLPPAQAATPEFASPGSVIVIEGAEARVEVLADEPVPEARRREAYTTLQDPLAFTLITKLFQALPASQLSEVIGIISSLAEGWSNRRELNIPELTNLIPGVLDHIVQEETQLIKALRFFQNHEISSSPTISELEKLYLLVKHVHLKGEEDTTTALLAADLARAQNPEMLHASLIALIYRLNQHRS